MKQETQCHSLLPGVNSLQFLSAFCLFPSCCVVQLLSHVQLFATHTRLPCPLLPPGACSDSCSLSWCCHPTISSSVVPFSSCLQSFPSSRSFQMNWFLKVEPGILERCWEGKIESRKMGLKTRKDVCVRNSFIQ